MVEIVRSEDDALVAFTQQRQYDIHECLIRPTGDNCVHIVQPILLGELFRQCRSQFRRPFVGAVRVQRVIGCGGGGNGLEGFGRRRPVHHALGEAVDATPILPLFRMSGDDLLH